MKKINPHARFVSKKFTTDNTCEITFNVPICVLNKDSNYDIQHYERINITFLATYRDIIYLKGEKHVKGTEYITINTSKIEREMLKEIKEKYGKFYNKAYFSSGYKFERSKDRYDNIINMIEIIVSKEYFRIKKISNIE